MKSSKNGKIYVGSTSKEPNIRVDEHNNSSNVWSKQNGPFSLKYFEKYYCKKDAGSRELFYKSGFGKQIKNIIIDYIEIKIINK